MSMQNALAIQQNMRVFTSDAVEIGRVKQIRDRDILIDRELARDIYVPVSLVDQVIDTEMRVELSLTESEYDERDWEHPPAV